MPSVLQTPTMVRLHAFQTAYPGSMSETVDGNYVRRDDPESLAAALIECIRERDKEVEDLKAALAAEESRATVPPGLIEALRHQRQIDDDGTEVGVSREAVDVAASLIERHVLGVPERVMSPDSKRNNTVGNDRANPQGEQQ